MKFRAFILSLQRLFPFLELGLYDPCQRFQSLSPLHLRPNVQPLSKHGTTLWLEDFGSGAAGIPLADRLSESGKSVLLIERGWASSGRWGGTQKPAFLEGTNLTRFDVPALYQYVWTDLVDNTGVLCSDISMPAGCILGGGTAINAGQFYLPTNDDWDFNQPPGFQSKDMQSALEKAKKRLPWTDTPSPDRKSYATNGSRIAYEAIFNTTLENPFRLIKANEERESRDRVTSKSEFFFLYGEKGGPMATYLVSASKRKNFKLQLNTTVSRVIRNNDEITGVEVEATGPGGRNGTIKVTPGTGRVILSAGVFNTAKILFRSGIGPKDQLEIIKSSSDGPKMVAEQQWITTPVGLNLDDGPALYVAKTVPGVETYDWEGLWNSTTERQDVKQYLENRTGPLAEIQPSLSPVSWDTVVGEDNKTRVVQWDVNSGTYLGQGIILFASNLNLGKSSRGRLTIDKELFVNASITPFFNDPGDHDFKAVLESASTMLKVLDTIPGSGPFFPPAGLGLETYLRESIRTQEILTSNHWVGSTRMGASCDSPDAVVDSMTKVCGTKNLHVVDAGIINGVPTANPQGTIIVAAERAAEVILKITEK